MKKKIVNIIMNRIKKHNSNLGEIKLEEIRYGLLGIYTLITKTAVIFILAYFLNIFREFIIFFIFYTILRSVGYGVHARNNISCWITSPILLLGTPYIFSLLYLNSICFNVFFRCFKDSFFCCVYV